MAKGLTTKQQKELNSLMEEFLKFQEKLIKNGKLGVQQQERYKIIQERINVLHKEDLQIIEEKKKPIEEEISLHSRAEKLIKRKNKEARKAVLTGKSHAAQYQEALDGEADFIMLIKNRNNLSVKQTEVLDEHLDLIGELGTGTLDLAALEDKRASLRIDAQEDEKKGADKLGATHFNSLDRQLGKRIEMGRASGLEATAMSGIDDLTGGMATKVKDAKDMMGKMGMNAGLAAGAIMAIVAILISFSGKLDAIGEKFGAIGVQSGELQSNLLASEAEAVKLGKGFEDVVESITTLTSEFGVGFKEAQSMANEVISISMGLGLSTAEGGQLIGVLSTIAGLSNDTSIALAQQATLLATSNDVAPQAVLQDIASSSETVAKFTHAGAKNIMEGAIQARKLGIDLETAASAAESMLDFQTAIEDAMTASVMIGRQVNIQKLQELSLAGNLKGVALEQRRLLGDQSDFLSMNVLQREALAKAVGLSVDQAAKMLDHEKDAITLAGELAKQEGFEKLIGPNTISQMTQLINNLKSVGAVLVNVLGPPLNFIVSIFANLAKGISATIGFLREYKAIAVGLGIVLAVLSRKLLVNALLNIWKGVTTMFSMAPPFGAIAGLAIGASLTKSMYDAVSGANSIALAEGGVVTKPTNALIGEAGPEAVIPLSKFADFMADAMAPVVASVNKLNEDFTKKHVPALALSNESGGKKAGREIGRQLQMNAAA